MVNEVVVSKPNIIKEKSYSFALSVIAAYKMLASDKEYVLSKQLLRSGTSIGANIEEALQAQSKADFIHKLSIAQKEAFEANYWLRLLRDSSFLPPKMLGLCCFNATKYKEFYFNN